MTSVRSERRLAENELYFREHNERIRKSFDALRRLAKENNQETEPYMQVPDVKLHFYCECSDENCFKRIPLLLSNYEAIHKNRLHFIIINGHQTDAIERVVDKKADYIVVEKYKIPPGSTPKLNRISKEKSN